MVAYQEKRDHEKNGLAEGIMTKHHALFMISIIINAKRLKV